MPGEAMNPSTFLQVRENMNRLNEFFGGGGSGGSIQDIFDRLDQLEENIDNIINNNPSGSGDITIGEDGEMVVNGITISLNFPDTDTTPGSYTRDVTFELKQPTAIGLGETEGFDNQYCIVVTYKHCVDEGEIDTINFVPQQVAYGKNMIGYTRTASDVSAQASWGAWGPVVAEQEEVQKQWVQSTSEPQNQTEGDYWAEPIS